jgi:hypothetical protein
MSDDEREELKPPEPPGGSSDQIARAAWKMAWKAEKKAHLAESRSLDVYTMLGNVLRETQTGMKNINEHLVRIEGRFDDLAATVSSNAVSTAEAKRNAEEARTSSSDLGKEVEQMEGILASIKAKNINSERVKAMVSDELQVLVTHQELDRLRAFEQQTKDQANEIVEQKKATSDQKTNFKYAVIVAIVGAVATGIVTYEIAAHPPPAAVVK